MSIRIKYFAALAFLASVFSCSKESTEPHEDKSMVRTERYAINLEAVDGSELRLAQLLDQDEMTKVQDGVFLEEKDLRVQLAVRRDGHISTQVLRLRKVPGQTKAIYTQLIDVPAGSSNAIELSAIILSELTTRSEGEVNLPEPTVANPSLGDTRFMTEEGDMSSSSGVARVVKSTELISSETLGLNKIVRTKIPYVAAWTPATLEDGIGGADKRISRVQLVFKPSGTLLRLKVKNTTSTPLSIREVRVRTNAFADEWYYSLGTGNLSGTPTPSVPLAEQSYVWSVSSHADLPISDNNNSRFRHYYVWVKGAAASGGTRRTEFDVITNRGSFRNVVQTTSEIKPGTMTVSMDLSPSKLLGLFEGNGNAGALNVINHNHPFSRLVGVTTGGQYNHLKVLAANATQLVDPMIYATQQDAFNAGVYYSGDELRSNRDKFQNLNIYGRKYYVPSSEELGIIFPGIRVLDNNTLKEVSYYYSGTDAVNVLERISYSRTDTGTKTRSSYKTGQVGRNIVYARRFYDDRPGFEHYTKLTAYRYEHITSGPGRGLKITTRYLGWEGRQIPFSDIAQESFWTDESKNGNDITITVPALGGLYRTGESIASFENVIFWSSTPGYNNNTEWRDHSAIHGGVHSFYSAVSSRKSPLIVFSKD